ncbi:MULTISPECIES: cytoplasmic filament protein CfpA [unclassified Oceanispirochaeta]|uniref:cytoplasmic filament protein CfpA n=1 Tax=unclassified Oceanispirochaeta TaxID=2635722 RepID=UPI000E08F391|nr:MULTISPECIES: cytoplasmic filament protein CfpA [unclassified Oceanispirochaeta]MBF9016235.1 cytochrome C oxidase subunit II [Oceanispirochaeta sp. M2]NPD72697.1 cytochrome C oxidase subunit II [Oceanispirochaeta sp. M1]RDG31845.1 cytochrome C oxidase subunit II [Oceanispirochaeta sp. M1]
MAGDLPRSPNVFHPTKPSAVGSRNSLAQDGRQQNDEFERVIQEESEKVLKEIETKLPQEVLKELDVMGGLKQKLYNYYNQNYQNMFNRYVVTTEDEMVKKIRGFIDKEENKALARYTPKEISEMLDQIGGADKFNTGEIEKSIVNMYGHLQGHVQRGLNDLENETNALLRQKTDVGAFIRGENAYSIIKCSFKDNALKPKVVSDVKLSINILESELISPIIQYQASVEYIIKDQISKTISEFIDREIEVFQDQMVDEGKEELTDSELMFERIKKVPDFTDDDKDDDNSKRFAFMAKNLVEKIEGLRAEIPREEFDPQNIRENIKRIVDDENIRNRGFNTAVNNLTSILDTSKMGYQFIENLKNARELIVKEYEDSDPKRLPDERYQIRLKFYDNDQLENLRKNYDQQIDEFRKEVLHLWDVVEVVYQGKKSRGKISDFDDLSKKVSGTIKKQIKDISGDPTYEEQEKNWNEIMTLRVEDTDVERLNQTYVYEKELLKKMLRKCREKVAVIFGYENPKMRVVTDQRIDFLEKEVEEFDYLINPYHVQPGLILDVDITSIKRKKYTLNAMANVMNEFLNGVSKGFQDAAFASFKRRRSTVRDDIDQQFGDSEVGGMAPSTNEYAKKLKGLNAEAEAEAPKGKADVTPSKSRRKKVNLDELSEI